MLITLADLTEVKISISQYHYTDCGLLASVQYTFCHFRIRKKTRKKCYKITMQ